jgi:hypothetical protein
MARWCELASHAGRYPKPALAVIVREDDRHSVMNVGPSSLASVVMIAKFGTRRPLFSHRKGICESRSAFVRAANWSGSSGEKTPLSTVWMASASLVDELGWFILFAHSLPPLFLRIFSLAVGIASKLGPDGRPRASIERTLIIRKFRWIVGTRIPEIDSYVSSQPVPVSAPSKPALQCQLRHTAE